MPLLSENYNFDAMIESRKALQKIQENKTKKRNSLEIIQEGIQKVSAGSEFFECYDSLLWEGKLKVDMLYFNQFLEKLEETEQIYEVFGEYFKNIRKIYEFINVKPEIYGKGLDFTILEKSKESQHQLLSNIIYEYFDRNFYSLSPSQRKEKYLEESRQLAKQLISEGTDPEEAISFSTKVRIVETLLQKIAFPFSVWSRINYLTESDDYRKVFDQEELVTLVDSFKNKAYNMSRIVAAIV